MSREKDLTKSTLIIMLGRVSTQFVAFLLLPLYTALLSKEEYGTVDLITTLVQLIIPVSSLMIDQGVFRYLLSSETEEDRKRIITSASGVIAITSLVTIILYLIVKTFVKSSYTIWLLLIIIVTAFSGLFLQIARGLKHTSDYTLGSFVCSASTIVLNVICIVSLKMGATGMLVATFMGNLVCCTFLFVKLRIAKFISIPLFSIDNAKEQLRYSVPLVPNQLSLWVMNSSDRVLVSFFLGTAANGVLAVSHKFPAIYMTFFSIFQLAWHETGAIHYFDEDRDQFFTDIVKKMLSIFSTLCLGIIVALPVAFNWIVNSNYNEAYYNIPIYMVAFMFNIVIGLLGVVYVATKKTTEIAKSTLLAAIFNIAVNVLLIKYIGLYAASISTFVGYLVTMVYRIVDTKKYLKIKYDIKQFILIGVSTSVCCFIYYLNNKVISLLFLPVFIAFAYFSNKETVNACISFGIDKVGRERFNRHKKKIVETIVVITLVCVSAAGYYICKKTFDKPQSIEKQYSNIIDVNATRDIKFSQFGADNFTCSGMTYDERNGTYWIADHGAMKPGDTTKPRIVEVNSTLDYTLNEIDLSKTLPQKLNLQGICYDNINDSFWLAVGSCVVEVDREGEIQSQINLGEYAKFQSNGICYDSTDDSLWVLCASKYIIHYSKDGNVLKVFNFNYADQDHIVKSGDDLLITVGADYQGNKNFVCRFSCDDGQIKGLYRTKGSNSLEGICLKEGKVYITNDGLYHLDVLGESYISVFDENDFKQ